MLLQGIQFVQWTAMAAVVFAALTAVWGFGIDIPRTKAGRQPIRVGGYNFTHHWFEHPMYFAMGLPIGSVSILLGEYVSVAWGAFIIALGTFLILLVLVFVGRNASRWLGVTEEPDKIRQVQRTLMASYSIGLVCSPVVLLVA